MLFYHFIEYSYLVKLNGYWSNSPADILAGGFTLYTMKINSAPVNMSGKPCSVFPSKGIALQTEFQVKCDEGGFLDEDIPLLYQWFYIPKNSSKWKSITFPSDGKYLFFPNNFEQKLNT